MTHTASTLGGFEVGPAPKTGTRVFMKGDARYADLLARAFPLPVHWYGPYESFAPTFDYVMYAQGIEDGARELDPYLEFTKETLFIPTPLNECWALSHHMVSQKDRSKTGQLVYDAKTYSNRVGQAEPAERLCSMFADRFAMLPTLGRCDAVTFVPANPPKEGHNLPELLARAVADRLGLPSDPDLVRKLRPTAEIKNLPNEDKAEALRGAYGVGRAADGERIAVVDDIVRSGTTLATIASALREAGASDVVGLVATKTLRS